MVGSGYMGPVALTATEIDAWQRLSGLPLDPWEFKALRDMSRAYVSQLRESETPACPPPYGEQTLEFDRGIVAKKIGNAFKSLMQSKPTDGTVAKGIKPKRR